MVKRSKVEKILDFYCVGKYGIIVTGSVYAEVLHANGSTWCNLPQLPSGFQSHTQHGLTACGSYDPKYTNSCVTLTNGKWDQITPLLTG